MNNGYNLNGSHRQQHGVWRLCTILGTNRNLFGADFIFHHFHQRHRWKFDSVHSLHSASVDEKRSQLVCELNQSQILLNRGRKNDGKLFLIKSLFLREIAKRNFDLCHKVMRLMIDIINFHDMCVGGWNLHQF